MKYSFAYLTLAVLLLAGSCTDPITVGSDLLEDDRASVGQTTELPFRISTVPVDSFRTYTFVGNRGLSQTSFSFGRIVDQNFGRTDHSVYLTPRLPGNAGGTEPIVPLYAQRDDVDIDSAVMLIPIDSVAGVYGPGREFPFSVRRIADPVVGTEDYFSDVSLATLPEELATDMRFTASLEPKLVRDTAIRSNEQRDPHVRIRMGDNFVSRFNLLGTSAYASDSIFRDNFAGVHLSPTGESNGLLNLLPFPFQGDTAYMGFNFYYTDTASRPREYSIRFSQSLPSYDYDPSGSLAGTLVDDEGDNPLTAVAGRGGLMSRIELSDLSALDGRVVNRAVLEIPVAQVEGVDYGDFPLPERVELFYRDRSTGRLIAIEDRVEIEGSQTASPVAVDFFLGGELEEDGARRFYTATFTLQLQRILDGEVDPVLFLRVYPRALNAPLNPARAFLNGASDTDDPATIRVTFTELGQ